MQFILPLFSPIIKSIHGKFLMPNLVFQACIHSLYINPLFLNGSAFRQGVNFLIIEDIIRHTFSSVHCNDQNPPLSIFHTKTDDSSTHAEDTLL